MASMPQKITTFLVFEGREPEPGLAPASPPRSRHRSPSARTTTPPASHPRGWRDAPAHSRTGGAPVTAAAAAVRIR
jgi:hypothetical protein